MKVIVHNHVYVQDAVPEDHSGRFKNRNTMQLTDKGTGLLNDILTRADRQKEGKSAVGSRIKAVFRLDDAELARFLKRNVELTGWEHGDAGPRYKAEAD